MKRYIATCFFIAQVILAFSQTVQVYEKEDKNPLDLVTLTSQDPEAYATTNAKGQADISHFKGSNRIEVRSIGYRTRYLRYSEIDSMGYKISMEVSNLNLDEIVLSASRWHQASKDLPVKIRSISPKEVSLQNPQTAADLLGITGKVFIQKSQQGGGSPMIRGFATNRLLYTVDGVRMNTAIFRGGNIQNVINLDPFATENTEVLFGPRSVVYGSDAIGGIMNFQTLRPRFSVDDKLLISGKAVSRYSSANDENTAHVDVNIGWKKWAMVTSLSFWDYDHLRQGSNGPTDYVKDYHVERQDSVDVMVVQSEPLLQIPTAYSQVNLMQKLRFKPNGFWDLEYGFHFSETSPYGRYDRHNRSIINSPRYAEWDYGPQKWMMHLLSSTYNKKAVLFDHFTLRLAQQTFEESRISRGFNSNTRSTKEEQVLAYSANLDLGKALSTKNTLFYGLEYVLNDVQSSGFDTDISTDVNSVSAPRYPDASWTSIAAYLNDEIKISEVFTVQAGLRYNRYLLKATFDTTFYDFPYTSAELNKGALTGSLGATYRPSESWIISSNLGTAFRSPNVDDMGKVFDSEPGSVVVPNPDLKAEYAYNADLGLAKVFGDVLKLDVSAYYTYLQDALVRRNFQLNGQDSILYEGELSQVQAIQNAAKARVYGLQTGLEVKLPKGFQFSTDLNFQKGEEELDNGSISPSRHAAPFFGSSRITYASQKLNIQGYLLFQGERSHKDMPEGEKGKDEIYALDANGNTYAPSWYTLNLKVMYQISQKLSISAGVENITDQRYRPYSSGISGAGRNFVASLRAGF